MDGMTSAETAWRIYKQSIADRTATVNNGRATAALSSFP
jgi:hypothetical protein